MAKKRPATRARKPTAAPAPAKAKAPQPPVVPAERHYRTEGQRRICSLAQTPAEIAAVLGVSAAMVRYYRAGTKLPGHPKARLLETRYGIPAGSWGQAAKTTAPSPRAVPADADQTEPLPDGEHGLGTSLSQVEGWLRGTTAIRDRFLDEDHPERPTAAEYLKAASEATRQLALRAKLLGDSRTDEEKLAASPRWQAIRALLARVLVRHPQAARDVADALESEGLA